MVAPAKNSRSKSPTAGPGRCALWGLRVLVADDDRIPRRIAAAAVVRAGGEAIEVEDGTEALSLWAAGGVDPPAFDAAVIDFRMPGMDGVELIQALRDLGFRGRAIGLTAVASEAETTAWLAAGCDAVLSKSATPADVVAGLVGEA